MASLSRKRKLNSWNYADVIIFIVLTLFGLIILYPFYNTLLISLVTEGEYIRRPFMLWPENPTIKAYWYVFQSPLIGSGFRTSLIVTVVGTVYSMLFTIAIAYALMKNFPGKGIFKGMLLFTMYFAGGLIPTYLLMKDLKLLDSIWVLILPTGATVNYIILLQRFFEEVPLELEESAKLDGCTEIGVLFKIILPLSLPSLATFGLYYAVGRWNAWYDGMLYIKTVEKQPIQTVLRTIIQNAAAVQGEAVGTDTDMKQVYAEGVKMASVFVTILPIMCVYPFLQRYFVTGLTAGAVKS